MNEWEVTAEELAYYKRNAQLGDDVDDDYIKDQLNLMLGHVNDECTVQFKAPDIPANVKLFIIGSIQFFQSAQHGLKSEKMGSVAFSYDFTALPKTLTDMLLMYGYGRKRTGAKFHVF